MSKEQPVGGLPMSFNQDVWKKLESGLPSGEKITARLVFPDKSKRLYAALDSYKQRHLLISLEENENEYRDSQSKGLFIITRDLVIKRDSDKKRYIDIICQDPHGHNIFDIISGEIADKLRSGKANE